MTNNYRKCSRCRKVREILAEFEMVTVSAGVRELLLCSSCTKWALYHIFTSDIGRQAFDLVHGQAELISNFLKQKKEQQNKQDKQVNSKL